MPEKIIALSDPYERQAGSPRRGFIPGRYRYVGGVSPIPTPSAPVIDADALGAAYERLGSMILAHKLVNGEAPVGPLMRSKLAARAGIPEPFASSDMTNLIYMASADQLGKGGVIGSIGKAVSGAVKTVAKAATGAVSAVSKVVAKVPIVGSTAAKILNVQTDIVNKVANSNIKGDSAIISAVAPLAANAIVPGSGVVLSSALSLQRIANAPAPQGAPSMAGAYPQLNPVSLEGVSLSPAGISLPGGPSPATAALTDPSFLGVMTQAFQNFLGIKANPDGTISTTGTSELPLALAGLGAVALVVYFIRRRK